MKLAIDLSSLLWTSLRVGKDVDGQEVLHNGKKQWINTAAYGYENAVNSAVAALNEFKLTPIDVILVREGSNSKGPRLAISSTYKASRGSKHEAEYAEWESLRDKFCDVFKSLGSLVVTQDYAEGDDTCGWLAKNTREDLLIMTNDGDLSVLNGVNAHGALVSVRVAGLVGQNKVGEFDYKFITLYKSMVGDTSDDIPGIPGFGKVAWDSVVSRFGTAGMQMLYDMAEARNFGELFEDSQVDKLVKKIYEGREDLIKSFRLAKIYPNWVDTMNNPLKWEPGMVHGAVNDERLSKWAAKRRLVTGATWEVFRGWAKSKIAERSWLALDIETSTPDESDDWLFAQDDAEGVDTIGSELTGMSLTFGSNMQYTVYIPVDHAGTDNVSKSALGDFLCELFDTGVEVVIHNTQFEGTVLYHEYADKFKRFGQRGLIPNWRDTKFEASYVDENDKLGLKRLSKKWFNYDQVDYKTTTTVDGVQKKMRELTAQHVFDYACDDTVTTSGLHNFFKLFMNLEGTYGVYEYVELQASYLHTMAFIQGTKVDLAKLAELRTEDRAAADAAKAVLDTYLVSVGWEGTVCPVYGSEFTAAQLKEAHLIVTGTELKTLVRTPEKVLALVEHDLLRACAAEAFAGNPEKLNKLVKMHFAGAPVLNPASPKQMQKLFYETLGLKPEVFNMPTEQMKKAGIRQGSPKTDNLAITYGLLSCAEEVKPVLEALRIMKMVQTRFSLFYDPLPGFVHWKTGLVHSSHNQCGTNTRRASSSKPNLQQLSKNQKVEGFSPRVRELYVPHRKDAVIVSLDFSSQELLLMAEWCKDPALVACFVGETKVDMHSTTGVGVLEKLHNISISYTEFVAALDDKSHTLHSRVKKSRALGKACNFGSQYKIAAKKLSTMLLVTETEAQAMLDAKAEAFPIVEEWSQTEMEQAKATGKVLTMLGAVRHLRDSVMSNDKMVSSKAPRQALSMRIQGSAAEMTKLAEGRMWAEDLLDKFDCKYFAAIHDELVWSVRVDQLAEFIPQAYNLMVAKYANMTLPISSSCSIGWNFGEQVELNGDFSQENINKALNLTQEPSLT